jgi:hypothetical protein
MSALTPKQRILLDEILSRDDDVKVIPWPRRPGIKIGLRLLSDGELSEADASARAWATENGLDTGIGRHRDNEFASRYSAEVLYRSLVHPESKQPVVDSVDALRARFKRQDSNHLLTAYNDFARDLFADPDALPDDQMAEVIERLRGPFALFETTCEAYGRNTLLRLLRFTACLHPESTGSAS